jgi:hypothetical protein
LASIVATPAKLFAQVKVTPPIMFPLASKAVALNCCVPFTAIVAVRGEMFTVTMVGVTVSVAGGLVTPEAVAVICVVPALSPVVKPVSLLTLATVGALLDHVKVAVATVFPLESRAVAAKVCCPLILMELVNGATVTVAIVEVVVDELPPQPNRSMTAANSKQCSTTRRRNVREGLGCLMSLA